MNTGSVYLVVIDGKPQGPFSIEKLKELKITQGTFVKTRGMDEFQEAHTLPELRALLGFSIQDTAPQYFAAFDLRLLAMLIDYFLITIVFAFFILVGFAFVQDKEERIGLLLYAAGIPLVKFFYNCVAEASAKQGTIGKRVLKIKVTDMMGHRIGLANAAGRNLAKIFSALPLFFGYLYSFLNKKAQCWHDIVAETLVVKERLI